ncbi:VOC family protein [Nocardia miyunensis]|uniref:VOC family protein n=1 Tax=Nocardia miyunensis TaxID=282684 RepID=UPI00082C598B|nr:glyoxalase/bleomycin resistance/dioxygenase family protein [Nocardia miyunensis]
MTTTGIAAVYLTTRNWGKAARFMQSLGYEPDFTTDHNSGLFRNGQGPYVFVAEVPHEEPDTRLVLAVPDAEAVRFDSDAEIVTEFEDTHFGTREMVVRDPDGRLWTLQAAPAITQADPA